MKVPEKARLTEGPLKSSEGDGNNGAFLLPLFRNIWALCIVNDGMDWEHVSVSLMTSKGKTIKREPNWNEMCIIKKIFWGTAECVVQYHPPEKNYINNMPFCLHLWRPTKIIIPQPPSFMVGVKDKKELNDVSQRL